MERQAAAIKRLNQLTVDASHDDEAIAKLDRFVVADRGEQRPRKWGGSVFDRRFPPPWSKKCLKLVFNNIYSI